MEGERDGVNPEGEDRRNEAEGDDDQGADRGNAEGVGSGTMTAPRRWTERVAPF